ncbi:hypothetical protein B566_EDAN006586 [Ephemera danica]|nr:hypothetical protein B566_EDAN006586 [Ephemera danica]
MMNLVTLGPGPGKQYLASQQLASWFEASYFCNAHGMDLVTIETQDENDALMNHIASIGQGASFASGHMIGRTTYLWINGEYMQYADWAPGEPCCAEAYSCLILNMNDWHNFVCNIATYFICEERILPFNFSSYKKSFV